MTNNRVKTLDLNEILICYRMLLIVSLQRASSGSLSLKAIRLHNSSLKELMIVSTSREMYKSVHLETILSIF